MLYYNNYLPRKNNQFSFPKKIIIQSTAKKKIKIMSETSGNGKYTAITLYTLYYKKISDPPYIVQTGRSYPFRAKESGKYKRMGKGISMEVKDQRK